MADIAFLLSGIEEKLTGILERQLELQDDLRTKKKEIAELLQVSAEQKKTISELEEKIRLLKLSKTLEIKDGAQEAKSKINELVREIDKCMGLLNT
jgi:phage shock protein A